MVAILVKVRLGVPVLFTEDCTGLIGGDGEENIFKMHKFCIMTDERDENRKLLSDEIRLAKFGKWLRSTSLKEEGFREVSPLHFYQDCNLISNKLNMMVA